MNLEDRTVEKLIGEGLLRRKSLKLNPWTSLAAAVIIFGIGVFLGSMIFSKTTSPKYTYVLLLHQDNKFDNSDEAGHYQEYGNWMRSLISQGIVIGGEKLHDEITMTNGTLQQSDDRITGFFLIGVDSRETAMNIAKESPHVKHGGTIEIREIANN